MSSGDRRRFFDGVKTPSEIKLRAFERYLRPWAQIVGSQRGVTRVWVVDGFAGAGVYGTGALGSAGLALAEARRVNALGRRFKMSCFFAEKDRNNYAKLQRLKADFPEFEVILTNTDFWSQVDNVVSMVGRDPAFLFVDPFGLGDLKFGPLVELCNKLRQVDLLVNFASPVARRLAPEHSTLVSEAVGGPGWTLETLTEVFCGRLQRECNFRRPAILPVQGEFGGLKYELVLAARHPKAYGLWNDEISRQEVQILNGPDQEAAGSLIEEAKALLRSLAASRRRFTRQELISQAQVDNCGEHHATTLRRAVAELIASGEWSAEPGPVDTQEIRRVKG